MENFVPSVELRACRECLSNRMGEERGCVPISGEVGFLQ